jgi:hypothetical protein
MADQSQSNPLSSMFQERYEEFASDLKGALPELETEIRAAVLLTPEERLAKFVADVLPHCDPSHEETFPVPVLPGVSITKELWDSLGDKSKKAIQEYIRILAFCCMYEASKDGTGAMPKLKEWSEAFMGQWKEKLSSIDFESMSKKLSSILGGLSPDKLPKLPERLLKGQLAKLAEELVREFKPEDFGLSEEELRACDKDPSKAFELLTEIYTKKPEVLQGAIQRIAKRLQEKVRRGELRPEQIAAEAEECLKEFTENGAFRDLMKNFKDMFGMEDPDLARAAGQPEKARLGMVRDRLRKKLEAKKAAANKK